MGPSSSRQVYHLPAAALSAIHIPARQANQSRAHHFTRAAAAGYTVLGGASAVAQSRTPPCSGIGGLEMVSKGKVMVAMSGGVDSSVAACLLKSQGYDVVGVTMKLWSDDRTDTLGRARGCCTIDDVEDARRVCQIIGAPHYVMSFQDEFRAHVIDYFVSEYRRGRTPHPCLACNDKIKFDFLLKRANALDVEYVATGHYARLDASGGRPRLLRGVDATKDQSYVLFGLRPHQMRHLLLPVGGFGKSEIRDIARDAGLPVADKPDSQEICFIPDNDYRAFLAERFTPTPGEIVDSDGNLVGTHEGIERFTVGQRRGLGVHSRRPLFVLSLDRAENRVVVGPAEGCFEAHCRRTA